MTSSAARAEVRSHPITLSVVTVSWNSGDHLVACVRSLAVSSAALPFEHILIDNASTDGGADTIEARFPHLRVIRNDQNLGFARANNIGAKAATGRYVLFLNPDTEVVDDAVTRMVAEMEAHPELGVIGPKLLDTDLGWSRDQGYRFPSLRTLGNLYFGISKLLPFPRLFPSVVRSHDFDGLDPCDWVSGAALMVRREVLDQEEWDERIFFFGEDIEYCARIQARGWRVACIGDARVVHHSGQSMSKQTVEFLSGQSSGIAVYLRNHRGPLQAWLGLRIVKLGYLLRQLFHRINYWLRRDEDSARKSRRLRQYDELDRPGAVASEVEEARPPATAGGR